MRLHETEDFFKYDKNDSSIGRFSRTPARVFVFENMVDNKTYKISQTVIKLLRQAIYNKMVKRTVVKN